MKQIFKLFCVYAAFVFMCETAAYEINTHAVITQQTVGRTVLIDDNFIQELGVDTYINNLGLKYYDLSIGDIRERSNDKFEDNIILNQFNEPIDSLTGWFMRGTIREDDCWVPFLCKNPVNDPVNDNRPLYHFYDPYNNTGLIATRAPDWALGSQDAFKSPLTPLPDHFLKLNHYTIFDAQVAMVRALSGQYTNSAGTVVSLDEIQRKAYWATTFRALGDVVHLVQDMGQPQHTRGDAHSYFNTLEQQVFEKFTNARALVSKDKKFICFDGTTVSNEITPLNFTLNQAAVKVNYPTPQFTKYSDFFSTQPGGNTQDGKGLADYSNRSFFTAGTNKGTAKYPSPEFNVLQKTEVNFDSKCVNTNAANFTLYDGYVVDQNNGNHSGVVSLTARSVWDIGDPSLPQYALTQKNYIAMADNLIPRAVAYSAGMINHFFRGRLDVTKIENTADTAGNSIVAITIKNMSVQNFSMTNGKLEIFYDAIVDGVEIRKAVQLADGETGDVTEIINGAETIINIITPTDVDPDKQNPFVVVYKGLIGVDPGVAGKVFNIKHDYLYLHVIENRRSSNRRLRRPYVDTMGEDGAIVDRQRSELRHDGASITVHDGIFYGGEYFPTNRLYKNSSVLVDLPFGNHQVASNSQGVFVTTIFEGGDYHTMVSLYSFDGTFQYIWDAGEWGIHVIAANEFGVVTGYESANLFSLTGELIANLGNNYEWITAVAATRDRFYVFDNTKILYVFDLNGNKVNEISMPEAWGDSMAVTENTLYLGSSYGRTDGIVYTYKRDVIRDQNGNITSETFQFVEKKILVDKYLTSFSVDSNKLTEPLSQP